MRKVKIFSTPVCPYCVALKEFFKQNDVEFEDIDVSVDDRAREEMIKKSEQMGVPVVEIDNNIVVGFDKRKILELLKIKE